MKNHTRKIKFDSHVPGELRVLVDGQWIGTLFHCKAGSLDVDGPYWYVTNHANVRYVEKIHGATWRYLAWAKADITAHYIRGTVTI